MRCCIYKTTRKAQNRSTNQRENDNGRDGDTERRESSADIAALTSF